MHERLFDIRYGTHDRTSKNTFDKFGTSERVASAVRQKMKQNRPNRIVKTMRSAPVLLARSVLFGLGARSACVTAISAICGEKDRGYVQVVDKWKRKMVWRLNFCPWKRDQMGFRIA